MKYLILFCLFLFAAIKTLGQSDKGSYKNGGHQIKELLQENYIISEKIKILSDSLDAGSYDNLRQKEFVE